MPQKSSRVRTSQAQNHKLIEHFIRPYRITSRRDFRLKSIDPGDTGVVVAAAFVDAIAELKLHYPAVGSEKRKSLAAAQASLNAE